ncbi:TPA: phage tail length tape measure family protein [Escherichia coli]|uniref:phage tail length tape measure family protein n=1 Tax=Escherichia coli TaxID=562 RepID=UPI000678BA25|nr:phage tail length tape measure family protein [Escherichia coli]EFA7901563.1 hypothetical protein [Escherichia coli]EFD1028592.1 hypothetical protein [Escherichia coli]EFU7124745.1 hypothetical protein [Escherichia coli]EHV0166365.1 phage tail length tape measure family protein [Escherichia coli]EKT6331475.1 phage tail length tape measure family protein [Escherichia coli]
MSKNVGTIEYTIDAKTDKLLIAGRQADDSFDIIERGAKKADSSIKTLNTQLTKTSRAISGNLRAGFQQAGYQIQDFVVQVQSGQNALIALSQQGSQLLSAFGGWGVALGAALTVGVSLFKALSGETEETTDKTEVFEKACSNLRQVMALNEQGVNVLSNEYANLAKQSAAAAEMVERHLTLKLRETKAAMGDYITNTLDAQNATAGFGMIGSDSLLDMMQAMRALGVETYDYADAMDQLNGMGLRGAQIHKELNRELDDMADKTGLSKEALFDMCQELMTVAKAPTADSISALSNRIANMNPTTAEGVSLFNELQQALIKAAIELQQFGDISEDTANKLDILKRAADSQWVKDYTENIKMQTKALGASRGEIMRLQLENKKLTAEERANAEQAIKDYEDKYNRLEQEKDAKRQALADERKATAERKRLMREAEQERKRIEREKEQRERQTKQAKRFTDQIETNYLTTVNPLTGQAADPLAAIQAQQQREFEMLESYRQQNLVSEQQYRNALENIVNMSAMRVAAIEQQQATEYSKNIQGLMNAYSGVFGELAGVISDGAGEQSAAYRAMFAVQKGFTIASAALSLQESLARANALPFPANIPAYAQALTAGTQIISAIRGIAFGGGRYNGGAVNGGKLYRVGERGVPELFTSTGGKQYMIPGEGGRVTPGRDLVGGGGITMNNTFNIQANNGWTEEDSKALQQTIENTAMRLMQRESQRPGGILQPRRR